MAAIPLQQTKKCVLADVPFLCRASVMPDVMPDPRPPLTDLGPLACSSTIVVWEFDKFLVQVRGSEEKGCNCHQCWSINIIRRNGHADDIPTQGLLITTTSI